MSSPFKPVKPLCYEARADGSLTLYFENIEEEVVYSGDDGKPDGTGNFNVTIEATDIQRLLYAGIDAIQNSLWDAEVSRR